MTKEQLIELKELAGKATPGPWFTENPESVSTVICDFGIDQSNSVYTYGKNSDGSDSQNIPDAHFIAAANPSVITRLVEELLEAREVIQFYTDNDSKEYYKSNHGEMVREFQEKFTK